MHKYLFLLFIATTAALSSCTQNDDGASLVLNTVLSDLKPLIDVAGMLYENPASDKNVIDKIEFMIHSKLVILSSVKPNINTLNINSIKGLCALTVLSRDSRFSESLTSDEVGKLANQYLVGIQPDLVAHTNKLKETVLFDKDCTI